MIRFGTADRIVKRLQIIANKKLPLRSEASALRYHPQTQDKRRKPNSAQARTTRRTKPTTARPRRRRTTRRTKPTTARPRRRRTTRRTKPTTAKPRRRRTTRRTKPTTAKPRRRRTTRRTKPSTGNAVFGRMGARGRRYCLMCGRRRHPCMTSSTRSRRFSYLPIRCA